ncbi:MAG: hypothetical protein IPM36_20785 [Lewinellaceae bacterium]|nr:hypothetical protein [Lewinellaceae bacterium]
MPYADAIRAGPAGKDTANFPGARAQVLERPHPPGAAGLPGTPALLPGWHGNRPAN